MNTSLNKISAYYEELGNLMWELSGHSRFFNLGYCEKGQRKIKPGDAQKQMIRRIADLGNFKKDMHLLDVGCGLCGPAHLISNEKNCSVIGIDPGTYQIAQTSRWLKKLTTHPKPRILYGDAMDLPFIKNLFDGIYSVESAFHYRDKAQFIQEASRILKPNGKLIIADILRDTDKKDSWLSIRLGKALSAETFFNIKSYKNSASQSGLECIYCEDITKNVARTFPIWARSHFLKFSTLLKTYRLFTLLKIGIALLLIPVFRPFMDFRYNVMVFQKIEG